MTQPTNQSFGLVIAYVIPGFTSLWGLAHYSPTLRHWLSGSPSAPTVAGFLYVTLASIAAGLTISAVRWLLIDQLHEWTGLRRPTWKVHQIQANLAALKLLIEDHYRFYQFYANTLVASTFAFAARRFDSGLGSGFELRDLLFFLVAVVLFIGSRDTLRKYYERTADLLGAAENETISLVVF